MALLGNEAQGAAPGSWVGQGRGRRAFGWFGAAIAIYSAGLLLWLVLGLLPTLADSVAPVGHWVRTIADSSSVLSGPARRILDSNQSMLGMAMEAANRTSVVLAYCWSFLNLVLGLILATRRSGALVPRLLAFALLGTAATFNKPSHAVFHILGEPWPIKAVHFTFHIVSGVAYLWAVLLFPDGRLPRRLGLHGRPLALVAAAVTAVIAFVSWRSSFIDHPIFFVVFFGVVVSVAGLVTQVIRVTDPATTPGELRSARLLGAALVPAFVTGLIWVVARVADGLGASGGARIDDSLQSVFPAVFAIVPVVLFAGILRYRLWDLDWVLSRALLLGGLAVAIGVAYVVVVSVIGRVAGHSVWVSVGVLSVVAVAIDPARRFLAGWSNRLVYGQEITPVDAVRSMLASLERLAPGAELAQLTETVTRATRAIRSEVWLDADGRRSRLAAYPDPTGSGPLESDDSGTHTVGTDAGSTVINLRRPDRPDRRRVELPVAWQGDPLGRLIVELPAGTILGPIEAELVEDLAAHAGVILHNAALNTQLVRHVAVLAAQLDELQASRRRLVAAQDAERRALERDLHDGAQQSLVAAMIGLRTLSALSDRPEQQRTEAAELIALLDETGAMLADLAGGSGPRVLIEDGLAAALDAAGDVARRSGLDVRIEGEVPADLPVEVAGAVYFTCLEALQNAAKHARAGSVSVRVTGSGGAITFEVADDGRGFDPSVTGAGSGLRSLGGRLSVLGGEVRVESARGAGTVVRGRLPLPGADPPVDHPVPEPEPA